MRKLLTLLLIVIIFIAACPLSADYDNGGVTKLILSNGLKVLVRPEPESSVVAIEVFIRVGASDEGSRNEGIGHMLAGTILAGTEFYSNMRLARLYSEAGGNFHAVWHWDNLEVYAITVPEKTGDTISLLANAVQEPKFDPGSINFAKETILREASRNRDDPFNSVYTAIRKSIHKGSGYEREYLGDPGAINSITREDLVNFHKRLFMPNRIVVSIVGNVDPLEVARKIEICFGSMQRYPAKPDYSSLMQIPGRGEPTVTNGSSASVAYMMLGYPAPGINDPQYPAMCVANTLLGGNKSSLLFQKLREAAGLGYQVGSVYPDLKGASHVVAYIGLDTERASPEVLKTIRGTMIEQFRAVASGNFTDDDLEHAKRYLIGKHALKHQRTRDRAFNIGYYEVIGLGYPHDFQYPKKIRAVTRQDVIDACSLFLTEPAVEINN